jgi:hypothetical protein
MANKKKRATKKSSGKKSMAKRSTAKKAAPRKKPVKKKAAARTKNSAGGKRGRGRSGLVQTVSYEPQGLGGRSAGQSGDLQGLSDAARADVESVDELLEEGNAFEAEVVKGVEDAPDADQGEIHTREVPEEDVPGEYFGDDEGGPSRRGKTLP